MAKKKPQKKAPPVAVKPPAPPKTDPPKVEQPKAEQKPPTPPTPAPKTEENKANTPAPPTPAKDDKTKNEQTAATPKTPPSVEAGKTPTDKDTPAPTSAEPTAGKSEPSAPAQSPEKSAPTTPTTKPPQAETSAPNKTDKSGDNKTPAPPDKDPKAPDTPKGKTPPEAAPKDGKDSANKSTAAKPADDKGKTAGGMVKPAEPPAPKEPPAPVKALRSDEEKVYVFLTHDQVHGFKNHPFKVKMDAAMDALVSSVKDRGVDQDGVVRESKSEPGKYEIVAGHRRQKASELANFDGMRYELRDLTDEEAIQVMVETNTTDRGELLPSERAWAMKMQKEAITRQGARGDGRRADDIVGARNGGISGKTVQRIINVTNLIPPLIDLVDAGKIGDTTAGNYLADLSKDKQSLVADAIAKTGNIPSNGQAKRLKQVYNEDPKLLNQHYIVGVLEEEKKEANPVLIYQNDVKDFFAPNVTPADMKAQIMTLVQDWSKEQPATEQPTKPAER